MPAVAVAMSRKATPANEKHRPVEGPQDGHEVIMSMNVGAAGYRSAQGGFLVPKKIVTDLYVDYHCQSIMGQIARPDFLADEDLKCYSEVTYPVLEDDDCEDCDQYQQNGHSEELGDPLGHRSVRICNNWRFHKKMSRGDMARMCESKELFKTSMQEYLNRRLDRKIDGYGLAVIAMSAAPFNQGNNAGMSSQQIDLGSLAQPWNLEARGAKRLVNNALQAFEEAEVMCSGPMLTMIVPPCFAARLREDQQVEGCCDENNPLFTGKLRHIYGFNVISSNRLPCKVVNGKRVYYALAIDHRKIGSPSDLLYMDWQIIGHDAILFGEFIWDTFVFNGKGVVVMTVICD
ncbi:MAG: hypothetical protein R3E87_07410 [Burkholderiaceae bacterium]